jgi:tryptophan-rich sensory protein
MNIKQAGILALCVVICFGAAAIGSSATVRAIPGWYAGLVKPPLNPPNYIFGPVWTLLYLLMAVSMFLVVKNGMESGIVRLSVVLFALQLILNVAWSLVFFGAHQVLAAFIIILGMWAAILSCIIFFAGISRPASVLMIPYLLWVSFAAYLNIGVWIVNK